MKSEVSNLKKCSFKYSQFLRLQRPQEKGPTDKVSSIKPRARVVEARQKLNSFRGLWERSCRPLFCVTSPTKPLCSLYFFSLRNCPIEYFWLQYFAYRFFKEIYDIKKVRLVVFKKRMNISRIDFLAGLLDFGNLPNINILSAYEAILKPNESYISLTI